MYNILIEFGIPMKLIRLIKTCLTETYSRVRVGKHFSYMLPIRNVIKQGDALSILYFYINIPIDALSPMLFKFAVAYAIRKVQVNQDGLKLNGTHQLLVYADDFNIFGGSVHITKENAEALASKDWTTSKC